MIFADVMTAFEDRVREVDAFFDLLAATDNGKLHVESIDARGAAQMNPAPANWGPMIKGAAYLIIYNLVEAFLRRGFEAVFDAVKADKLCGIDLSASLREQWIMQKNRKVKASDGSPNVYMRIANDIVKEITGKTVAGLSKGLLPISGNLDASNIRKCCSSHGVKITTDKAARGGDALETIKAKRNSLAHGDESFAECGRNVTATELLQAKNETVLYMRGVLKSLETFASSKGYKA